MNQKSDMFGVNMLHITVLSVADSNPSPPTRIKPRTAHWQMKGLDIQWVVFWDHKHIIVLIHEDRHLFASIGMKHRSASWETEGLDIDIWTWIGFWLILIAVYFLNQNINMFVVNMSHIPILIDTVRLPSASIRKQLWAAILDKLETGVHLWYHDSLSLEWGSKSSTQVWQVRSHTTENIVLNPWD